MNPQESPAIDVRQVSQLHARWQERGDGVPGRFVLSVLLDDGAMEIVAEPPVDVLQAALPLIAAGETAVVHLTSGDVVIGPIRIATGGPTP